MNAPTRRRTLDFRFLTVFLVLTCLLGVGTHFLHGYQVNRNANALLEQANRAEADKDADKFADYLGRYVGFRPDDLDAASRYAVMLEQRAKSPLQKYRAFLALEDVLRRDTISERPEVRMRAAHLAIAINRPADARAHLERLLQNKPEDAELEDMLGQCEEESKQFAKARTAYEISVRSDPTRVHTAFLLARLLRSQLNPAPDLDKAADADKVMDTVIQAAPDSFEARMVHCRYLQSVGNLNGAENDLARLREKIAPDNIEVIISSAELAQARHRNDEARKFLELGHKRFPNDTRFTLALARLELRSGKDHRPAATAQLQETLKSGVNDPETLWTLADLFIDTGDMVQAQKLVDRLILLGAPPASLDFLKARLLAADGKIGEAVACLERCRAGGTVREGLGFLSHKMNFLLGGWYEQLGNPDQQMAAYERVLSDEPLSVQARAGKAAALAKMNRIDDALTLYRSLINDVPALRLNTVRLLMARNLHQPSDQRNWGECERLLQGATPELQSRPEYQLLQIDLLAVSGRRAEAVTVAEAACKSSPKEVRFWLARAALAERGPKPDAAKTMEIIADAEKQLGDLPDLRLARAVHAAAKPRAEARQELLKLEEKADGFPALERGRLEAGLATVHLRIGDNKDAIRLLTQAATHLPDDIVVRQQLFDLAMLAGDDDAAAKQVKELRQLEGEEGVLWRYEDAARLVQSARRGNAAALNEARQQIVEVSNRRRDWHRVLVLEAEIAEMEGRTDLALLNYQKAIDRGERSQRIVRRAVQFLANRRRTDEARLLLQKVIEQSAAPGSDLNRMLVEVSLPDVDSKQQSIEMARAAVSPTSNDYHDFLWLGQVLSSLGEKKEAEEDLRKSLRMQPKAPEPRVALVVLLAESGRKDEARAETDRAQRELPELLRAGALGPCREALGEAQKAETVFVDMLKAHPNDPGVKRTVAAFYLRNAQAPKAEPYLRSLASSDGPDACWGRRTLALMLAVSGEYPKTREALELLDKNVNSLWSTPEDQRVRAMVLAMRPGDRRASIQTLEESFLRIKPSPAEEFLLAQLYEADRNWVKASERLLALALSRQGATPEVLAFYVKALLRHDQAGDARTWLDKLEKLEPNSARTAELKARLLIHDNKADEAGRLLTEFARKDYADKKKPLELNRFASLLSDLGRPVEAEQLYRFYVAETEKTRPESPLSLASFLASHNRLSEALDLCDRAATRCAPEMVAGVAVGSLRLTEPTDADRARVRTWLEGAVAKKPDSVPLLVARADLLDASGDYAGSEQVYRDLLERNPRNVLALNNLAWLLAVHANKGDEALQLIDRAIELVGPNGDLLDTQASVYLVLGRPEDAAKRLQDAVLQAPTGPRFFHLAQAYEKAGQHEAAKEAWIRARKELLLNEKALHPLERTDFQRFNTELGAVKG